MRLAVSKSLKVGCLGWLLWSVLLVAADPSAAEPRPASLGESQHSVKAADFLNSRRGVDQTLALIREASLALLKEGNARYAAGKSKHPNQGADRRSVAVEDGQKPFATILACSDSRSPVEVLFDRGVGELFVVRVAGNVADESQVASIEYGVEHLGTPLLVVLGHTGCGAVTAAVKGGELHGHLAVLIDRIKPAVAKARAIGTTPDRLIAAAIQANIWQQIEEILSSSGIVRNQVREGALQIVGGIYDLEKGTIAWLGSHPTEDKVIGQADEADKTAELARNVRETRDGAAEPVATPEGKGAQEDSSQEELHAPAVKPLPSFPFSLLPSKTAKARTRNKPQDIQSEPHH